MSSLIFWRLDSTTKETFSEMKVPDNGEGLDSRVLGTMKRSHQGCHGYHGYYDRHGYHSLHGSKRSKRIKFDGDDGAIQFELPGVSVRREIFGMLSSLLAKEISSNNGGVIPVLKTETGEVEDGCDLDTFFSQHSVVEHSRESLGYHQRFDPSGQRRTGDDMEAAVKVAVVLLQKGLFSTENLRSHPQLIRVFSKVLKGSHFFSPALQITVLKLYSTLLMVEKSYSSKFARDPKVLESLVLMTTSQGPKERNVRAVSILITLSNNATNRRLLAKQPGLLSSLILFSRSHQDVEENQVSLSMSNNVKKQILLLAKAL